MAQTISEDIRKQLAKPQVWFCKYFPVRIRNVGEDAIEARNLVWAFKDAKEEATERVAQMTAGYLVCQYGGKVKDMTFVCVQASSEEKNVSHYKHFCQRVSELSGIANGFSLVHVSGERPAVHEHRHDKLSAITDLVEFDAGQIKGKTVCIFDDVISTGQSYGTFADRLERLGANVAGGIFLGRTHYRYKKRELIMEKTKDIKAQSVCFSGHCLVPQDKRKALKQELRAEIVKAYARGVRNFYCGMALGFDTLAATAALSLQCELPGMKVVAVVPFCGQSDRWTENDRELYKDILANVDETVVLSRFYYDGCLLRRNDYMLERSCGVIAYFDGQPKGGTYYTCKKARSYGLDVINLYDSV